jgi:hypothetical protein
MTGAPGGHRDLPEFLSVRVDGQIDDMAPTSRGACLAGW